MNPIFEPTGHTGSEDFARQFFNIDKFKCVFSLRSKTNPDFRKLFEIEFDKLGYIGDDLADISAFDFQMIALRISDGRAQAKKTYWTSNELLIALDKMNALDQAISMNKSS